MTQPSVRRATTDDLDAIESLADEAGRELRPQRGGAFLVDAPDRVSADRSRVIHAIDAPDRGVWVAAIDDAVVGYAVATMRTLTESATAVIDELFTSAEARSVGVGERLVEEIVAWAIINEATGVSATALPGARATKNFFEGLGMKARAIVVHRDL